MALSASSRRLRTLRPVLAAGLVVSLAVGCTSDDGGGSGAASADATEAAGGTKASTSAGGLFDASFVHDIEITYDQAAYDAMIATFQSSGDKEWIEATVVIDGETYERAGIRLKGNSSLMGIRNSNGRAGGNTSGTVSTPNALPWLVRLDKYVDGRDHKGTTEFVVRSNNSQTALNEAVALELLGLSGQPIQKSFATRFTVNGSAEKLRLVVENPADEWEDANFENDGVLYKAESGGDYSYRGEDAESYKEIFDQETDTDNENFAPLTRFLKFINEADDATFAKELGNYLEIDAFADYLAGQQLVANFDDIDGPGNNSYLRYDATTKRITIVSWDLNLAFGSMGGGGGAGGAAAQFPQGGQAMPGGDAGGRTRQVPNVSGATGALPQPPTGQFPNGQMPNGQVPNVSGAAGQLGGRGGGAFGGRSNILVTRFTANAEFNARYEKALADMKAELYGAGTATEVLDRWKALLVEQVSDLVPAATIEQEASSIAKYFTA